MKLNYGTLLVAVVLLGALVSWHPWANTWTGWQILGAAIAVPASGLFLLARIQLGRAFSVQAKATTLATQGIYAHIRHPIYVFGALMIIGLLLVAQRPWWLLIFVVLIPVQLIRVRREEEVLEAAFGDAYREYKRTTWF